MQGVGEVIWEMPKGKVVFFWDSFNFKGTPLNFGKYLCSRYILETKIKSNFHDPRVTAIFQDF